MILNDTTTADLVIFGYFSGVAGLDSRGLIAFTPTDTSRIILKPITATIDDRPVTLKLDYSKFSSSYPFVHAREMPEYL